MDSVASSEVRRPPWVAIKTLREPCRHCRFSGRLLLDSKFHVWEDRYESSDGLAIVLVCVDEMLRWQLQSAAGVPHKRTSEGWGHLKIFMRMHIGDMKLDRLDLVGRTGTGCLAFADAGRSFYVEAVVLVDIP
jgi:hypothetical protein